MVAAVSVVQVLMIIVVLLMTRKLGALDRG